MMPIIKHFDPVMGIDIHIVTIPPVGPVPIPHPHIALVLDPMDYIPIIGATVLVGGIPRGTAGTSGKVIPHIPMGGPFIKPPMNEDELFMVFKGTLLMDFRDGRTVEVKEGEILIVPKGVEHRPHTNGEIVFNLLFEPKATLHTGTVETEMTVKELGWI